jgi:uncharacterized membrane protein YfhO
MLTYENNRMVLEVDTPEAAFLFMSEAYYPGWQAYVDGAIPLGPGSHRVEVVFEPLSFKIGLSLSLLTVFLLLLAWLISTRRRLSK